MSEQITTAEWQGAIAVERQHQRDKWGDDHDREHGVDHLLVLAQDYGRRGRAVEAAALVQAARDLLAAPVTAGATVTREQVVMAASMAERLVYPDHAGRADRFDGVHLISGDDIRWLTTALNALGLTVVDGPTEDGGER